MIEVIEEIPQNSDIFRSITKPRWIRNGVFIESGQEKFRNRADLDKQRCAERNVSSKSSMDCRKRIKFDGSLKQTNGRIIRENRDTFLWLPAYCS